MYTSKEVLKSALVEKGFSSVKFPGGGGDERRHTSIVVMWCLIGAELVFVVLPHRHLDPKSTKYISEYHTKDETPYDTAVREAEEETLIVLDRNNLSKFFEYKFEKNGELRKQYFFTAKISIDTIENITDLINENQFEEDSGYPICVTLSALVSFLNEEKSNFGFYTKVALRYAVENIHQVIPEAIGSRCYSYIAKFPGKEELKKQSKYLVV